MRAKQEDVVKERERQIAIAKGEAHLKNALDSSNKLRQAAHKQKIALSFDLNEEEDDDDEDEEVSNQSTENDQRTDENEIRGTSFATKRAPGLYHWFSFAFDVQCGPVNMLSLGRSHPTQQVNQTTCRMY